MLQHRALRIAAILLASLSGLTAAGPASASLIGAEVSYRSLFPNTNNVLNDLGTKTVTPLTDFNDVKNGIDSFFIGSQLVIQNTSPLAFAGGAFNGPHFAFSAGGLTGATSDAATSTDFQGMPGFTGGSVQANFAALTPALGSTMTIDLAAAALLAGQQVSYTYLVPTETSVQENLGTQTLGAGTFFHDAADGITVVIGADRITILNDVPLAFAGGDFNGPDLVFSSVHILNAAIDPLSAADFQGALAVTPDTIAVNFASFAPAAGHALVIDVTAVPEPGTLALLGLPLLLVGWLQRGLRPRARAA